MAGMMLGKNGPNITNGDYVPQEELEFTVVKKEKIERPPVSKLSKLAKALPSIAISVGLVALIPWIMHANSVTWHHVGPEMQNILHTINLGLGKLINANYLGSDTGLWKLVNDSMMNADALESSLAVAGVTYGLTAAGIAKLTHDIKHGLLKTINIGKEQDEKEHEEEKAGGKNL